MSELGEDACAVGTIRGHLALLLIGEVGQGGGEVEGGLGQGHTEQEAHGTQTQRQHGQRRPGRCERAGVTVQIALEGRRGPPLSPPLSLLATGWGRWRGP
jgi:hypothetical protein